MAVSASRGLGSSLMDAALAKRPGVASVRKADSARFGTECEARHIRLAAGTGLCDVIRGSVRTQRGRLQNNERNGAAANDFGSPRQCNYRFQPLMAICS